MRPAGGAQRPSPRPRGGNRVLLRELGALLMLMELDGLLCCRAGLRYALSSGGE